MQVPAIAIAGLLVIIKVDVPHVKGEMGAWEKVKRIDWAGSAALTACVSLALPSRAFYSATLRPFQALRMLYERSTGRQLTEHRSLH